MLTTKLHPNPIQIMRVGSRSYARITRFFYHVALSLTQTRWLVYELPKICLYTKNELTLEGFRKLSYCKHAEIGLRTVASCHRNYYRALRFAVVIICSHFILIMSNLG